MDSSPASSNIKFTQFIRNLKINHLLTCSISVLLLFLIFYSYFLSNKPSLKEGDIVQYDIYSQTTVKYIDKEETEKLRKNAEENVPVIYTKNPLISETVISDIENFFLTVLTERKNKIKKTEDKLAELEKFLKKSDNTRKIAEFLLSADEKNLELVRNLSIEIAKELLDKGVQDPELSELPERIENHTLLKDKIDIIITSTKEIIMTYIRPNFVVDQKATDKLKEEARQKIVPVIDTIFKNEKIAEKGEVVTPEIIEKLTASGIISHQNRVLFWIISIIYPFFLTFLLLFYIYKFGDNKIISDFKYFVLLYALTLICVTIIRFTTTLSPFIIPVFIFLIPLVVIYGDKLAFFVNSSTLLISLFIFGFDIQIIAAYVVSGLFVIMFFNKFKTPSEFIMKGVYSSIALSLIMLLFTSLPQNNFLYANKFLNCSFAFANGIVSCFLALGIIFALEQTLGFLSPLKLFELSDPNSVLLRKIFESAPGTYQHSVVVANLSSHAAEAINANYLLTRVGSYYHDLGKIEDPLIYTENNSGSNIFDRMDAFEAVSKIKAHVAIGIKIANEYKLPDEIKSFIREHQGTAKISFIYDKIKAENNNNIDEKMFRYDGPKPQSKETAIVMIADSAEASVRSLKDINTEKIENLIENVIKTKLSDGQLDDAPLTLKDLTIIKESFISTLLSLYHIRVAYPEEKK